MTVERILAEDVEFYNGSKWENVWVKDCVVWMMERKDYPFFVYRPDNKYLDFPERLPGDKRACFIGGNSYVPFHPESAEEFGYNPDECAGHPKPPTDKEKLIAEKEELDGRIMTMFKFIITAEFRALPADFQSSTRLLYGEMMQRSKELGMQIAEM